MNTTAMRDLAAAHGPFASIYLPSDAGNPDWPVLRRALTVRQEPAPELLAALEDALSRGTTTGGRALIANRSGILIDGPLAWSPHNTIARLSALPYLLPLVPRHAVRAPEAALVAGRAHGSTAGGRATTDRALFDQFLFEAARPGSPVVQGVRLCAEALRNHNAEALVMAEGALADRTVWVAGTHRDHVAGEAAELRALGMPSNSERADEAFPMAALAVHAEVLVATADISLTDGVGVLLRHP